MSNQMIATKNLMIRPEMCQRLDAAIYSTKTAPAQVVVNKAEVYRAELLMLIATYSPEAARIEETHGLYRLYTVAERLVADRARETGERGRANMQTAHNQLKNYK